MKDNKKKLVKKTQQINKPKFNFAGFTTIVSDAVGNFWSFILALVFVLGWSLSGPLFNFSDTWQLVINTSTTIITFLMVFLIQHTQNRDVKILNLKLDELIKSHGPANNTSIDLNKLSDEGLKHLENEYKKLCKIKKQAL